MFSENLNKLKKKMSENNIDLSIITDDDSIYYFTGYHDFLHMDFYRPTLLVVSNDHKTYLITPLLDVLLVPESCPVDMVETWNDGIGNEWRELLPQIINQHKNIFIEKFKINPMVKSYLDELLQEAFALVQQVPLRADSSNEFQLVSNLYHRHQTQHW